MLRDWLVETRPQTLLLSATNVAVGCGLGMYYGAFNLYNLTAAVMIILTAVLLQVLSNLANDYGDAVRGSDRDDRLGPIRAVMTGAISIRQLRRAMAVVTLAACFFGLIAVAMTLGDDLKLLSWFIFAGVISIVAAVFYTVGVAYGYKGLGDAAVFIFFGLLSVLGPQVMLTNVSGGGTDIYPDAFLLAVSIGAGSMMVLHINNMRDAAQDKISGKRTLATRLGAKLSTAYHVSLFAVVNYHLGGLSYSAGLRERYKSAGWIQNDNAAEDAEAVREMTSDIVEGVEFEKGKTYRVIPQPDGTMIIEVIGE